MSDDLRIAVVGASGFVGSSVVAALEARGHSPRHVVAPRLRGSDLTNASAITARAHLGDVLAGAVAVVNAAGVGDATGGDEEILMGANCALPALLAEITTKSGARLVHISSAAVQGRVARLDESTGTDEFSPYARSKAAGERSVLGTSGRVVVYRPPGVHAADRQVTRTVAQVARSPFASVAGAGSAGSPQALASNVGDAVAYLATCAIEPARIVMHPSEGVTVESFLTDLGGRPPRHIPAGLARTIVALAGQVGRRSPRVAGNARRLEMMWFGQDQGSSWLTAQGWQPPVGREGWRHLGAQINNRASHHERGAR